MAPHRFANLEGNKWIVDTEALSLKATLQIDRRVQATTAEGTNKALVKSDVQISFKSECIRFNR
jgi:hypothetical protein